MEVQGGTEDSVRSNYTLARLYVGNKNFGYVG